MFTECGFFAWQSLDAGDVLRILRAVAAEAERPVVEDALVVVLAHPEPGRAAQTARSWARKAGLDEAGAERAAARALRLAAERAAREAKALAARLEAATPEAAPFAPSPWAAPTPTTFDASSRGLVEFARATLAKAGGSGVRHEGAVVGVLAERDAAEARGLAAFLERFAVEWIGRFEQDGVAARPQARIEVVLPADQDRWRMLVATATRCDPDAVGGALAVYPTLKPGEPPLAMVLIAPGGDPLRLRFDAATGVARAILHYAGSPFRGPPWLNEGMPLVMAELSVKDAGMDEALRREGLAEIRGGGTFGPLLAAGYLESPWNDRPGLATSLSYIFVRRLYERDPRGLLRFLVPISGGAAPATTPGPWAARFREAFGRSVKAADAEACRWFMKND